MWKKTKEIARSAEYAFKNKDEVQKRVLEATRDDDDQITENEYLTVAHLTADPAALSSIRKTLWKRFSRITKKPTSCRKALQILDYCIRYGSEKCLQMALEGQSELQMVANSHHFSSDKPRDYMNEDQCRNLVQNLLAFIKNRNAYDQARSSGQSTIQRVKSYYVEPLQVKLKPDNNTYYGNSNSYAATTNTNSYGNSNSAMDQYSQTKASYSLTPETKPQNTNTSAQTTSSNNDKNGLQWSSDSDSELETDPRAMSRNNPPQQQGNPYKTQIQGNSYQAQNQGGTYQTQQNGFNLFNQPKQNTNTYQNQSSNPFQTQPQTSSQNQNPFSQQQQTAQNPFQSNQSNPFNSQPQPQQQQQQANLFSNTQSQQQSSLSQQEQSFFTQPSYTPNYQPPPQQQQPPSADELLFGPSPSQKQQQQSQFVPPQPDPTYNGIVDFSNTPMQPYSAQPMNQQYGKSNGMLDEFGDLVDLNLNKGPTRAHGRPEMQRGYNQYQAPQYQPPQYQQSQYQQKPY